MGGIGGFLSGFYTFIEKRLRILHSTTEYLNDVCRVICTWPHVTHMWSRANCAPAHNWKMTILSVATIHTTTRSCHHVGSRWCFHLCHSRRCTRSSSLDSDCFTSIEFTQFLRPSVEVCLRFPLFFSQSGVSVFWKSGLEQRLNCW